MSHRINLTKKDASTLDQIFDPESTPSPAINISSDAPDDPHIKDSQLLEELKKREKDAIVLLEKNVSSELGGKARVDPSIYKQVLDELSELISEEPSYASVRNNRAQLLRLQHGDHVLVIAWSPTAAGKEKQQASIAETILTDLDTALDLLTPTSSTVSLSRSQARTLAQAHTQRAALLYTASKDAASHDMMKRQWRPVGNKFEGWTADRFEEAASRDFFLGGLYGNELSKAMAVHTNPHAKLCGAIIQEALRKEYAPGLA
ncbi:hypothetical protein L228DRAFT_19001 [Xylona heveae TC161]|uniref:Uncharacterized protein n=1 Tax=Xylona heveae (strain CBS 132557 / TC161) TaxID=1328760 RepID=A0A165JYX5_XYLHT|nr:hypothetical protein L228DRAFT_19001 [Xylona heveae TC161]KZF26803.1 hypothetical protein L228DRAFT_19001 [Xylona heveae TC161]